MAIEGPYRTNGRTEPSEAVVITKIGPNQYRVENPFQWEGVGIFDGEEYNGVFRYKDTMAYEPFRGMFGMHHAKIRSDGSLAVHGSFRDENMNDFHVIWVPE